MAASGFGREHPIVTGVSLAHLQDRRGALRRRNASPGVVRLAVLDLNAIALHVLPLQAEALFGSQAAIEQDRGLQNKHPGRGPPPSSNPE